MKTKRILWAVPILLALSSIAAMDLPKHEEPKVIGDLSKKDVSGISKHVLDLQQAFENRLIQQDLLHIRLARLTHDLSRYASSHIVDIYARTSTYDHTVLVRVGISTNKIVTRYWLQKKGDSWKAVGIRDDPNNIK